MQNKKITKLWTHTPKCSSRRNEGVYPSPIFLHVESRVTHRGRSRKALWAFKARIVNVRMVERL